LKVIAAYETFCASVEDAFDWLRYLSTQEGARVLPRRTFAQRSEVQKIASEFSRRLETAQEQLEQAPGQTPERFAEVAAFFIGVNNPSLLYDAVVQRHAEVQKLKPPEGKREWFEHSADGSVLVRIPYRLIDSPEQAEWWRRPYRLRTLRSFCQDLRPSGS
jgi:hypothetical protein